MRAEATDPISVILKAFAEDLLGRVEQAPEGNEQIHRSEAADTKGEDGNCAFWPVRRLPSARSPSYEGDHVR